LLLRLPAAVPTLPTFFTLLPRPLAWLKSPIISSRFLRIPVPASVRARLGSGFDDFSLQPQPPLPILIEVVIRTVSDVRVVLVSGAAVAPAILPRWARWLSSSSSSSFSSPASLLAGHRSHQLWLALRRGAITGIAKGGLNVKGIASP